MKKNLSVIIPAGGAGRRMLTYGPKAIVDIGGEPLIIRQLRILKNVFPLCEVVVTLGFEHQRIVNILPKYVKYVINDKYDYTNVVYSLNLAITKTKYENYLIVYGDLIFSENIFDDLLLDKSFIIVDNQKQMRKDEVGVNIINGEAAQLSYNMPTKWAQIAYLTGIEAKLFKGYASQIHNHRCFGYEGLNFVLNNGGVLKTESPKGARVAEIDGCKDIAHARKIIQ